MKPVLCLVTDRRRLVAAPPSAETQEDALVACVTAAARAGVHLIQVRERDLDGRRLTRLVRRCVEAVHGTAARVLVNDRMDVALAADAHGVHLPGHGVAAPRVRALAPPGFVIGRSVHHSTEAARVAEEGGVDYLVFGTVFSTTSKAGVAPAGVQGLAAAVSAVSIPVLAIGGITLERMPDIARSGAGGVAAIGLFVEGCAAGPSSLSALVAAATRAFDTPGTLS